MSCHKQEQPHNLGQTNGNYGCLIIRRRSWQMNSGCESVCHKHTVKRLSSDWPDCYPARYEWITTHNDKSIPTLALPPTTKAIEIAIGGTCLDGVGWRGSARSRSESPMHVYTASLNRVGVSTLSDFSPRVSASVSTPRVRVYGAYCGSEFTVQRPDLLTTNSSETATTNSVVVITANSVHVNRLIPKTVDQVARVTSFVSKSVNKNKLPKTLPPLPRFETDAPSRQKVVRITASKGCGVVLETSPAHEHQSFFLRRSDSCGNLLSHTNKSIVRPSRCTFAVTTPLLRTSYSLDCGGSFICNKHHRNTTMPNAPLSGGLGSAKASCSPTSHSNHVQPRISTCPEYSMSGNRSSPSNIFGISPVLVPSVGKPNSDTVRNGLNLLRSPKKRVNQEQYFRVQLPCTRAASRSKDFVVTDSLKLYENQLFNRCNSNQRPQSWCIDLGPETEELAPADDSHSASPTSTVSSYSSSSSSDRSQNSSFYQKYPVRPAPDNITQGNPQSRMVRWPIKLGSPSTMCQKTIDEVETPTSASSENVPADFELATHSATGSSKIFSQSPTEYPPSHSQLTDQNTVDENEFFHCPMIACRVESNLLTSSAASHSSKCTGILPITVSAVNAKKNPDTITNEDCLLRDTSHNAPQFVSWTSCNGKSSDHFSGGYQKSQQPIADEKSEQHASTSSISHLGLSATVNVSQSFSISDTFDSYSACCRSEYSSAFSFVNPTAEHFQPLELNTPEYLAQNISDIQKLSRVNCPLAQAEDDGSHFDKDDQNLVEVSQFSFGMRSESQFPISETSNSDAFTTTTPLPNEFCETLDMNSASDFISAMDDDSTYAFSTLDSEYLAWMRLSVKNLSNHLCSLTTEMLDQLPRTQVHHWVDIFNLNSMGLRLNFVDTSCRLAGTLRIYINLIKPVKMSLRQSMDILPESTIQNLDKHGGSKGTQQALPAPARLFSFFLPRGTSKVIYITSATTAINAIQCLLDRFHIQESSRKFALYEHTLQNETIVARKLDANECPLLVLLNWVRKSENRDEFCRTVRRKRIVLQENDGCDINWAEFTAAELANFLRILDKEEAEYKNAILHQYGMLKVQVEKRLKELADGNMEKIPT